MNASHDEFRKKDIFYLLSNLIGFYRMSPIQHRLSLRRRPFRLQHRVVHRLLERVQGGNQLPVLYFRYQGTKMTLERNIGNVIKEHRRRY